MSENPPAIREEDLPTDHGKFSINEDWLATVVGLVLLALVLTGVVPVGVIP
jgi:hypothetical protein